MILLTPSLKESRSSIRTISDWSLFHRILLLGKTTAGSKLHGCGSVYSRERERERVRVHVTSKSLGFLKICWYLYAYITIDNSVEHEQAGINVSVFKGSPTKIIKHC